MLDVPPVLFWDDPDDDEDPYLSELSEFEQSVVLRNASTQALVSSQWPAAREELIYRLSIVSPDAPMPLEDMRQARNFFKPADTEAKDLLARAIVIAAIAEREFQLWISVMDIGYNSRMVSYLEKNPDGLSESDVAWALEEVNKQSQLLLYANVYNLLLGSARLQYSE